MEAVTASHALSAHYIKLSAHRNWRRKLLGTFVMNYKRCPFFEETYGMIETIIGYETDSLSELSTKSIVDVCNYLEIKTKLPHLLIDVILKGEVPSEHVAQVQGSMLVTGRSSWSFMSYCPKLQPLVLEVPRDDAYCAQLAKAIGAFNEELDALVSSFRGVEQFRSAA